MKVEDAFRLQLARQVAHWRSATIGLGDVENFAAPAAWSGLERYLSLAIRGHLADSIQRLRVQLNQLRRDLRSAATPQDLAVVRRRLVHFRKRFLRTETVVDFFGDAVNTRTSPRLAALLSACDQLAFRSMDQVLTPLGKAAVPVLSYVDRGLGASILKANLRLWDGGALNPVAAIKVVRHNLLRPAGSLFHESGHQVAHILGWNEELAENLNQLLADDRDVAEVWSSWASEITADVHAFAHTGYASVATLHDVLAADERTVFRFIPGDPHPVSYLRVLLGVAMCEVSYGAGPWRDLGAAWVAANSLDRAPVDVRTLVERSASRLDAIAATCLTAPMKAFGNRPVTALLDPGRVAPKALEALAAEAGPQLTTSSTLLRREGIRIAALLGYRAAVDPERAASLAEEQEDWMGRLGRSAQQAAA